MKRTLYFHKDPEVLLLSGAWPRRWLCACHCPKAYNNYPMFADWMKTYIVNQDEPLEVLLKI